MAEVVQALPIHDFQCHGSVDTAPAPSRHHVIQFANCSIDAASGQPSARKRFVKEADAHEEITPCCKIILLTVVMLTPPLNAAQSLTLKQTVLSPPSKQSTLA